jgi:hypothetical protein
MSTDRGVDGTGLLGLLQRALDQDVKVLTNYPTFRREMRKLVGDARDLGLTTRPDLAALAFETAIRLERTRMHFNARLGHIQLPCHDLPMEEEPER